MRRQIADLDPILQPVAVELVRLAAAAGIPVVITCTRRTAQEQERLYAQGRLTPGRRVTNAHAADSPHCAGLAFDVAFRPASGVGVTWSAPIAGAWEQLGAIGMSLGLVWGGTFKGLVDRPHFEWPNWRHVKQSHLSDSSHPSDPSDPSNRSAGGPA
jgi:peptidoglycan LD-endopeptidase CwlK